MTATHPRPRRRRNIFATSRIALIAAAVPASVVLAEEPPLPTDGPAIAGVVNAGFEGNAAWTGLVTGNSEHYAPVEGSRYAVLGAPSGPLVQETGVVVQTGMRYEVTVWARSIYDGAHTALLAAPAYQQMPVTGTTAEARARLTVGAAEGAISTADVGVSPRSLLGDAASVPNDDGANVWVDGGFRVQFADSILYQALASDPITDPWQALNDNTYDQDLAVGIVNIPGGQRLIFDCFYSDDAPIGEPWESLITVRPVGGAPLSYTWGPREVTLYNERQNTGNPDDQFPWVIDAHAFWDADAERLWMSWGGHDLYITELDPATGLPVDDNGNPISQNISTLDPNVIDDPLHTMIIQEQPEGSLDDPWRRSTYQEGPAIYKHGGFYYYFATYGNLVYDYTIRVGRSTSPRGPYLDREGNNLINGGGTFVLGDDTEQLVPGHPHIWEESGVFYMGYDYRTTRDPSADERDFMGIRRLHWVDGWPTIWRPVTVSFSADDHPEAIGQRLTISVRNAGDSGSVLAIDRVRVRSVPEPCAVDFDFDGQADFFDVINFLSSFDARAPGGDFDANGEYDAMDVLAFLQSLSEGCPINRILPLGASRVEGARPEFESFRYELWKDLIDGNWTFDFIGTRSDDAVYPLYNELSIDVDHEGGGGGTSGQILSGIEGWLSETGPPDIVLFSSPGGNDALEGLPYDDTIENINNIIDVIQADNPNVTIVIEQLAPGRSDFMTPDLASYINRLQQEVLDIAGDQSTSTSRVIAVDMFTDFDDSLLADDIHYNEAGAEFIATRYYNLLQNILD